jgi:hypothetical protein
MQFAKSTSVLNRVILSEQDVLEIYRVKHMNQLKDYKQRTTAALLARSYGVGTKTIRNIWSGRTWKQETQHLRGPCCSSDLDSKVDISAEASNSLHQTTNIEFDFQTQDVSDSVFSSQDLTTLHSPSPDLFPYSDHGFGVGQV